MARGIVLLAVLLGAGVAAVQCTSSLPANAGTATVGEYCAQLAEYVSACPEVDPCSAATSADCKAIAAGYTAAGLGALRLCAAGIACGEAGATAAQACDEYWFAEIPETDAQAVLASDYCKACTPAATTTAATTAARTACAGAFYATVEDGGLVIPGAGFVVLPRADSVAAAANATCVPRDGGEDAGCAAFAACALGVVQGATPAYPPSCAADADTFPGEDAGTDDASDSAPSDASDAD
jgi:hypothetical protein